MKKRTMREILERSEHQQHVFKYWEKDVELRNWINKEKSFVSLKSENPKIESPSKNKS